MSKFTYHNRSNPCPICNSTSSKCRSTQDELLLCMTFADCDGDNRNYKFLKPSKDGLWGLHIPKSQDDFDSELAAKRREEREQRKAEEERRERELLQQALPLERRSSEFRKLLLSLQLDDDHYQNLINRGLIDTQIKTGLFKSVVSGQSVAAHPSLPGIRNGRLWFGREGKRGFLCPALNSYGQIIGCQVRLDNSKNGRYRWLKGRFSSHLPNGELPLTVVIPQAEKMVIPATETMALPSEGIEGIVLAEGILKPFVSAYRYDERYITMGAAGGNFTATPKQLKATLDALSKRLGKKEVMFATDAGAKQNHHVYKRDRITVELLQSWGYEVKVGHWGQWENKAAPDFDELLDLAGVQWVAADEYFNVRQNFLDWLQRQVKKLPRGFRKGFGQYSNPSQQQVRSAFKGIKELHYPCELPSPEVVEKLPKIIFKQGERLNLWDDLRNKGWLKRYQFLLDLSWTGTGKSYESALLNVERVLYFDIHHRNVSTQTVRDNFCDLHPRLPHGLTRNRKGELIHAKPDTPTRELIEFSNCKYGNLFAVLSKKGYGFHAGGDNPLCNGCNLKNICKNQSGTGYGYKFQRSNTLAQAKIRLAPQSAPSPSDYDYSNTTAIVEEAHRNLIGTNTLDIGYEQLLVEMALLEANGFGELVKPMREKLTELVYGDQGKWGISHDEIVPQPTEDIMVQMQVENAIALLENIHVGQAEILLAPDRVEVDKKDYRKFKGAVKTANAYFQAEAKREAKAQIEAFPTNVLPHLLRGWYFGEGAVRIKFHNVFVTYRDERFSNVLKHCQNVLLLDATPHYERIGLLLGIDPEEILEIQEERPELGNLTVYQTYMEGLGTQNISDLAKTRVAAYRNHKQEQNSDAKFLGFKKWQQWHEEEAWWFNHNIGSNKFQGITDLTLFGTPYCNIGAVQDELRALLGKGVGSREVGNRKGVGSSEVGNRKGVGSREVGSSGESGIGNRESGGIQGEEREIKNKKSEERGENKKTNDSPYSLLPTPYSLSSSEERGENKKTNDSPDSLSPPYSLLPTPYSRSFPHYYEKLLQIQILQAIGRPRSHRYLPEQFQIDFVGKLDLGFLKDYGINVIERHAFEVCPETGTERQVSQFALLTIMQQWQQTMGKLPTQAELAESAKQQGYNLSERYIRKLVKSFEAVSGSGWKALKKAVLEVLTINNNESTAFENDAMRAWLDLSLDEVLIETMEILRCGDWSLLMEIFASASIRTRGTILGRIMAFFWQDDLDFVFGVSPPS